jgi:Tol biopolymer transport system component
MNLIKFLPLTLVCAACETSGPDEPVLAQSVDPGGCILQHVAVEEGTNQYQYDSFSPDGSLLAIAWDRGEERGTYLLNLETWERTDVPALNNGATFSPNGKQLLNSVYVSESNTDIALYDRETKEVSIFAPDDAYDWLPSYSPDGSKILFNSFRTGNSDVYLYDVASETLDQLTDSRSYDAHAQFSPDGDAIVYHEQISATDFNVVLLNLQEKTPVKLTSELTEESYPSWSRDGEYIAYASDRAQTPGVADIFIMTSEGDVKIQVTDTAHKDGYPFWSPDGEYLYFTSYREPQGVYRTRMTDLIHCERED